MSTVAAKFSHVSTNLKVGAAAVSVAAAATLTPAIVHAEPSFAPITQALGSSIYPVILEQVVAPGTPGTHRAASPALAGAVTAAGPLQDFITGLVQTVTGWFYQGLHFLAATFEAAANFIALVFKIGPYGTGT
jgi:hypothetical protein